MADADADSAGEIDCSSALRHDWAAVGECGGWRRRRRNDHRLRDDQAFTISGTLAQVNADLSTLDYAANGVSTDSIDGATSDSRGGGDDHQIAVSVNATPITTVPGNTDDLCE